MIEPKYECPADFAAEDLRDELRPECEKEGGHHWCRVSHGDSVPGPLVCKNCGAKHADDVFLTSYLMPELMDVHKWRIWQKLVAHASLSDDVVVTSPLDIVAAECHIRALLAENLQLRQDCERLRVELEPLRQHYEMLKRDTKEYIAAKETRENEAVQERLGLRPKRAWWRRWLTKEQKDKRLHPLDHVWE